MENLKIIIVDDHKIFRKGLRFLLEETENVSVVGEAENGYEFLDLMRAIEFDIVLMDINMPMLNGIEATVKALKIDPDIKIVILSMQGDEKYYQRMVDAGVKGFLLKSSDVEELSAALKTVNSGGTFFSQELLLGILEEKRNSLDDSLNVHFTEREIDVLKLICKGYNTNQIANELFISHRTVERHRANLLAKTNEPNSIALVLFALKNKIIQL